MNKKKKSTNISPYPDDVIDRLARAFYPAILACWNSEEGQRSLVGARPLHLANARPFGRLKAPLGLSLLRCAAQTRACLWQAEQAHHTPSKEKQSVPDGERPVVHIAIVCGFWQGASGWRTLFLFCLIFPCSAVLFSLPTDCKCRRSPRTPRTQTTLFRSKISNALMTQSSLLARREFFRTSPHYKSAPIRSFCDFEQRASPKNHQKVELHKTSLQSCRVLL